MKKCFKVATILCVTLFALFLAACSATGDETVSPTYPNKTVSNDSSNDSPSSNKTSKESSSNYSDISDTQDEDSQSSDDGSIKPTISCPKSHPVLDWFGECHACDDETSFKTDDEESCERLCNGKNGTTKRVKDFFGCRLAKCPDDKPLMEWNGNCKSCKYDGPVSDTTNCSKCSNRKIQKSYCVIANCKNRPLLDNNGFCYPCSTSLSVQTIEGECTSKCPNRRESGSWSFSFNDEKSEGTWCDYNSEGAE